jgi:hypothetical protein
MTGQVSSGLRSHSKTRYFHIFYAGLNSGRFFLLHLVLVYLINVGYIPDDFEGPWIYARMSWSDVKIITTVTTFFEVFFSNQCFHRYSTLYDMSRTLVTRTSELTMQHRLFLGPKNPKHCRLGIRYVCAAIYMFFADVIQTGCKGTTLNDGSLLESHLILSDEADFLEQYSEAQRHAILIHWSTVILRLGCESSKIAHAVEKGCFDDVMILRLNASDTGLCVVQCIYTPPFLSFPGFCHGVYRNAVESPRHRTANRRNLALSL